MSAAILKWLSGSDTGQSSKAIAYAALGGDPSDGANRYPSDGSDFGRCHRLLALAPEARTGLTALTTFGGPCWAALGARWDEIAAVYEADLSAKTDATYELMKAILRPIEDKDRNIIRMGGGVSVRFGR